MNPPVPLWTCACNSAENEPPDTLALRLLLQLCYTYHAKVSSLISPLFHSLCPLLSDQL